MENLEEKYQEALQAIAYLHNELLAVKHCHVTMMKQQKRMTI